MIVKEATKYKEYDFVVVAKMIENLLPIFKNNKIFIELYDLITDNLTTRKGDIQREQMYLNRAKLLSQDKQNNELESISLKIIDRIIQLELLSGNVEVVTQWIYVRNIKIVVENEIFLWKEIKQKNDFMK